jgi:hypothetical protein
MSLTEIARFADLSEAQIAASRLRAEGVQVLVQNEYWGGADFIMTIAMGGFRLWAPEGQAAEAKALIAELRAAVPPPEPEVEEDAPPPPARPSTSQAGGVARTGLAILLALVFGWAAGLLVAGPRRHPAVTGVVVVLAVISGLSLAVFVWSWWNWAAYAAGQAAP